VPVPRKAVVLGIAIALLFGVSLAVIFLTTGGGPAPEVRPAPAAAPAPPPAAPALVAGPAAPAAPPAGAGPAPPPARASAPPALSPDEQRDAVRQEVFSGLGALRAQVARCAEEPAEARRGSGGPRGPRTGPRGRVVLTLDIETLEGQARILDARPSPGGGDDWRVGCARDALRGQVIAAPHAVAGVRFEIPFALKL
jgi:hypothetical protein